MGKAWFAVWSILVVFQAPFSATAEESTCTPGFESDKLIFTVTRRYLRQGTTLGKVGFTDCTDHTALVLSTSDSCFVVKTGGVLMVKRPVVLHEGRRDFFIHLWDSQGRKLTIPVSVRASQTDPEVPVLPFSKSDGGLRRRKRDWIIPDLYISENKRGQYPLKVSQIRSSEDAVKKTYYSITGPGADQPPVGLFRVDRDTGNLYVTQPLDREQQARYMFLAHVTADGSGNAEDPMEITVIVTDQNDNKPVFTQSTFMGKVSEASVPGFEVITVVATDADEPNNDNSDIRYSILNQEPQQPKPNMFEINPINGVIRVAQAGLDRERWPQYTLTVQASDLQGEGLSGEAKVILQVADVNNNAPVFTPSYEVEVAENKVDALVIKMSVSDADTPFTPAWNAKFAIIAGDPDGLFTVKTGPNKQEGIISTAMGLDFEKSSKHTLLVKVENEDPFHTPVSTSTATVVVNVEDVNEAPVFDPKELIVRKPEGFAVDSQVAQYTATDPDTARKRKVEYGIISDPAGWLMVDKDTGIITVKSPMVRESPFVRDNRYTALIAAYDDDEVSATATASLIIEFEG